MQPVFFGSHTGSQLFISISSKVKRNSFYLPMSSTLSHATCCYLDHMKIFILNLSVSR